MKKHSYIPYAFQIRTSDSNVMLLLGAVLDNNLQAFTRHFGSMNQDKLENSIFLQDVETKKVSPFSFGIYKIAKLKNEHLKEKYSEFKKMNGNNIHQKVYDIKELSSSQLILKKIIEYAASCKMLLAMTKEYQSALNANAEVKNKTQDANAEVKDNIHNSANIEEKSKNDVSLYTATDHFQPIYKQMPVEFLGAVDIGQCCA